MPKQPVPTNSGRAEKYAHRVGKETIAAVQNIVAAGPIRIAQLAARVQRSTSVVGDCLRALQARNAIVRRGHIYSLPGAPLPPDTRQQPATSKHKLVAMAAAETAIAETLMGDTAAEWPLMTKGAILAQAMADTGCSQATALRAWLLMQARGELERINPSDDEYPDDHDPINRNRQPLFRLARIKPSQQPS